MTARRARCGIAVFAFVISARVTLAAPCATPNTGESQLEAAARGLAAAAQTSGHGEWCTMTPPTQGQMKHPSYGANILDYAGESAWSTRDQLMYYAGFAYGGGSTYTGVLSFEDGLPSGTWRMQTGILTQGGEGHFFDTTAAVSDDETKFHIRRWLNNNIDTCTWNDSSKTWSCNSTTVADVDASCQITAGVDDVVALKWDASRSGLVLFADGGNNYPGDGHVCFWNRATNSWSKDNGPVDPGDRLSSSDICPYDFRATYTPGDCDNAASGTQGCMWLSCAGTGEHWKDQGGVITRMTSTAPTSLGCCGQGSATTCREPLTNRFVVGSSNVWAEYDIASDSWTTLPSASKPNLPFSTGTLTCATDSTHGLVLYLACGDSSCGERTFIAYRHAGGTAPDTAPPIPGNAHVQ